MADQNENKVEVLNPSQPAAGAVLPQWAVVALTVLVGLAATAMAIPGLPPIVTSIAGGIVGLGAVFGIASPGIRRAK
jgi:hypothetical protein